MGRPGASRSRSACCCWHSPCARRACSGGEAVKGHTFLVAAVAVVVAGLAVTRVLDNQYYYFAAYVVLQYVVLATAWNILGGYTGYVNFGTLAFFALGVDTAVGLIRWVKSWL